MDYCSVAHDDFLGVIENQQDTRRRARKILKVYRVQDAEGRGPWRPGFSDKWVEDRTDAEFMRLKPIQDEFPNLDQQLGNMDGKHAGVGCETLAKLRQWFTKSEYETLLGFGYQCVCLNCDRIVATSDIQCVFVRSKPLNKNVRKVRLYG
jgi:hypothetical protein